MAGRAACFLLLAGLVWTARGAQGAGVLPAAWRQPWPWPWPFPPDDPSGAAKDVWAYTLAFLWNQTREHVGFCVGDNQRKVLALAAQSFPWPLPVGPPGDALCRWAAESLKCGCTGQDAVLLTSLYY